MKRILACLDGSHRAPFVLETAVELSRRMGLELRLFRAVGIPPEIDQEMAAHSAVGLMETVLTKARTEMANLAKAAPPDRISAIEVRIGSPWDSICREAEEHGCDLIVLGSHGYSGLDRILGTTAAKVVNHAKCSVLVCRPTS